MGDGEGGDWQVPLQTVSGRASHLLKSEQWSDCSFIVGSPPNQKLFNVHKVFLAMTSPVFEAMFFGGMGEPTMPIPILDVQPEAFKVFLEYIYADAVNIKTFDQACEVCYAAKKYMLPHLVKQCTRLVFQDLSASNACKAYEFAKLFEEQSLLERSQSIIFNDTDAALADPSFEDVELATLLMVLDAEYLTISSERALFNALHRWAVKECLRKSIPDDINGKRSVIGPAFTKIRFLSLTPKEFAEGPGLAGFLTRDESFAILMNISDPASNIPMPEGFSDVVTSRCAPPPIVPTRAVLYCNRFQSLENTIAYRNPSQIDCSVSFTVDKDIIINGIKVPTQSQLQIDRPEFIFGTFVSRNPITMGNDRNSYNELLYAHLLDSVNSRLTYQHFTGRVEFNDVIDLSFNSLIRIQRGKVYKITVVASKTGMYNLHCHDVNRAVYSAGGVTFTFMVNGDPLKGSFIRSILYSLPQ